MNMDTNRRVTRADVARAAGVSTGTVSHVLSDKCNVTPDTRERVHRAIRELGYRPNRMAGALRGARTKQLGVLSPKFDNPHFGEILSGVQQEAASRGYVVICAEAQQDPSGIVDTFIECRVDAVIMSSYCGEVYLKPLIDEGVPIVTCGYQHPGIPGAAWVMPDHENGTRAGVFHACDLGHTRIGILSGGGTLESGERLEGWTRAFESRGLEPRIVVNGNYSYREAAESAEGFVDAGVTLVLVANDMMAISLMSELLRLGVRVPDDISVVGYDDIWISGYTYPTLTSVRIFSHGMGVQATRTALTMATGGEAVDSRVPTELVVRDSTRRLR